MKCCVFHEWWETLSGSGEVVVLPIRNQFSLYKVWRELLKSEQGSEKFEIELVPQGTKEI